MLACDAIDKLKQNKDGDFEVAQDREFSTEKGFYMIKADSSSNAGIVLKLMLMLVVIAAMFGAPLLF